MKKKILFICTGNYYRSRFAEIWFNHQALKTGLSWEAFSRGFRADNPANTGFISPFCCSELGKRGLMWDERSPLRLTEQDLEQADMRIALKRTEHLPMTRTLFPGWEEKILFWDVHDIDVEEPAAAIAGLEIRLNDLMNSLLQKTDYPYF